ncbi:pantetheine-phosphate adenylyltransferase [archaeon]|jgi:pantetheine-phosphate adenylyltransferase|nr:pantetheine-phosphate adenylyltransferase [archaeon]MBT3578041.1 pantetheine-phosphate adenylyltransferase [archaeon]MBT6819986.1 pantetheine-phosphate adenylyltransferase [archaeon]MBT6956067.1 pantetheine-phosphate adenylyltransferase [archaeon]MBT7025023.1 pantetheine-phosphate adenylyltransferase [archaeon]
MWWPEETREKKFAVYPLSGDPVHNGHVQSLASAVNTGFFDKVYFAMGKNSKKNYLFSLDERLELAKKSVYSAGVDPSKVIIEPFSGLLRNYARRIGADFVVRGSRNAQDFDYEMTLADFNAEYGLQTVILPAAEGNRTTSSSMVKAVVSEGGMVDKYVHPAVKQALEERMNNVSLVGVTGNMGAGKSTFCGGLVDHLRAQGKDAHHIDFDKLIQAQYTGNSPVNLEVREQIKKNFGRVVFDGDVLNKKKLARRVFRDPDKMEQLSETLRAPALMGIEDSVREMKGVVLLDAAYLTKYGLLSVVNYNAILVGCDEDERLSRVSKRDGLSEEETKIRFQAQQPQDLKKKLILQGQEKFDHGFLYEVDTTGEVDYGAAMKELEKYFPLFKSEASE